MPPFLPLSSCSTSITLLYFFIICSCIAEAPGDVDKFDELNAAKRCSPECKPGQQLWFKKDLPEFATNGCGADHFSFRFFHFLECCDIHDACMSICGANVDICDRNFQHCIERKCEGRIFEKACVYKAALITRIMNQFATCSIYNDSQTRECECYNKDDFKKKLLVNMRHVYKHVKIDQTEEQLTTNLRFLTRPTKGLDGKYSEHNWKAINWILDIVTQHTETMVPYSGKSFKDTVMKKLEQWKDGLKEALKAVFYPIIGGTAEDKKSVDSSKAYIGIDDEYVDEYDDGVKEIKDEDEFMMDGMNTWKDIIFLGLVASQLMIVSAVITCCVGAIIGYMMGSWRNFDDADGCEEVVVYE